MAIRHFESAVLSGTYGSNISVESSSTTRLSGIDRIAGVDSSARWLLEPVR
jgi:hypothetical protein